MNTIRFYSFFFGFFSTLISPMSSARIPNAENRPVLVNQPSLDLIDEHLPSSTENNETEFKPVVGPSLDLIDFHPHDEDDENEADPSREHRLIQPSFEILDAQLHGGDEHVHEDKTNHTDGTVAAANLDDFYRWLKEQNDTDQLHRFLSLKKEVNRFHLDDSKDLNDKINRNIEELKLAALEKDSKKHELCPSNRVEKDLKYFHSLVSSTDRMNEYVAWRTPLHSLSVDTDICEKFI